MPTWLVVVATSLVMAVLVVASVMIGAIDVSVADLVAGDDDAWDVLLLSRVPRTTAILLAGSAMAVAGLVMQMLVRNRFVEPSTVGTTEAAGLGLLLVTILAPAMPLPGKIGVAAAFALAGTLLFLAVLRAVPVRSIVTVPLLGMMLAGVIGAVATWIAYRYDLLQTLGAWMTGDFSGIVAGRMELLWVTAALAVVAYVMADRFTVAGLGKDTATALGLPYGVVMALGLGLVAVVSAVVVVVVGGLPFLGLVVPNVASLLVGDNLRRTLPWVAVGGAGLVLLCDVLGRVLRYPYEIPIGVVMGVVGSLVFLYLLLRAPAGRSGA
ncbi:iron ABC transporter permease [Paraoerskovia sediminicola]|uniref:Iron ABC transporter permease n=1 Tax=Paraoerskovia sediminicola TaxID=1138587 RepID=A0ABM8G725_9CELL|nr:iron chelate uptake ABC transporter family permease subunit [Paraoerskovia sediminicola]BDZ43968.1 iron ABC transporter permease [Paraoerskovia sediminicola]